jgi:GNAT superfamily N-acetyltransferase
MSRVTVSPATDEEVRSGDIGRRLRQFNYGFVGEYLEVRAIRLNARDAAGNVVGGLRAVVAMHWLRVEVLFVDEDQRRTGIGSALLLEAERIAREMGAKNAALETFEWQGPGFYAKHGYAETGRIERYAGEFYLALMAKCLEG